MHSANVDLGLETGKVCLKLLRAVFERFVEPAESRSVELSSLVELIHAVDLSPGFLKLRTLQFKQFLLLDKSCIGLLQIRLDLVGGEGIGTELLREESARARGLKTPGCEIGKEAILERVAQLLGPETPQKLSNASVGVVGASGTGTPALNVLARSKIGKIVVVDPGQAKDSNHQRNLAMRFSDLDCEPKPYKVALARRMVVEINPEIEVRAFIGDILDDVVLDELLRCDVILGCSGSHYARAALGDIATQYLVPVIDLAVQMRAEEGILREQLSEIAYYTPGSPCPPACG